MTKLNSLSETKQWAQEFARGLSAPVTVALHGDLGAGKTEIARAIINELCGDTVVPSPTFTIVQNYSGTRNPPAPRLRRTSQEPGTS
ncbi:MAG: tRNA (adenosine(37)-N6)-threonylcarbamoyltransferase complex ATPase subunit type 1 TsaE, partial [Rickettsiales bacterium]|nr:tRNA (adenosine(37)-N6)-threonylcarbamoyltransferase complex ATPase subunit type 1 TsaE [Rickettsiales bacterium]